MKHKSKDTHNIHSVPHWEHHDQKNTTLYCLTFSWHLRICQAVIRSPVKGTVHIRTSQPYTDTAYLSVYTWINPTFKTTDRSNEQWTSHYSAAVCWDTLDPGVHVGGHQTHSFHPNGPADHTLMTVVPQQDSVRYLTTETASGTAWRTWKGAEGVRLDSEWMFVEWRPAGCQFHFQFYSTLHLEQLDVRHLCFIT